jgi:transcriptional regulator with XRE-family HTH domain
VKNQVKGKNMILKIGNRIRKRRLSMGWTMMELSYEAETDYRQIGRIERGETNFTIGSLVKISSALGISLKELVK